MITENKILEALSHVMEPDLKKDLVSLGMIKNIQIEDKNVSFTLELTTPACPLKEQIQQACINAVKMLVDKEAVVNITLSAKVTTPKKSDNTLKNIKNIIAVASGKGGVGKSTIAAQLAYRLAQEGASVGLLDCDIYGPSVPLLFGLEQFAVETIEKEGKKLMVPAERMGVKILSIGFMVAPDQAIPWRGPMLSSAVRQLVNDADWDELDYLVLDMPPGTGDVAITVSQMLPISGAIIVTTPQALAISDAGRAISMFRMQGVTVPILGVVENMSYFVPPDMPEKKYHLFGEGGGERLAKNAGVPLLANIPLHATMTSGSDKGALEYDKETNEIFATFAREVARLMSVNNYSASLLSS